MTTESDMSRVGVSTDQQVQPQPQPQPQPQQPQQQHEQEQQLQSPQQHQPSVQVSPQQNVPMKKRKKPDELDMSGTSGVAAAAAAAAVAAAAEQAQNPYAPDPAKRVKLEDPDVGMGAIAKLTEVPHPVLNGVVDGDVVDANSPDEDGMGREMKRPHVSKAREIRLEQNRKAARESRRRKKVMIEELQRSVIFFSRANGTLKQQNDELSRLLMQAQAQVAATESGANQPSAPAPPVAAPAPPVAPTAPVDHPQPAPAAQPDMSGPPPATPAQQESLVQFQQAQAQAVATQAMYESQGFPPAAARAAAQTMNGNNPAAPAPAAGHQPAGKGATPTLPPMQPGATMQAMANFQQAAAAAMQAAMGMNPTSSNNNSNNSNANATNQVQPPYSETLNALAMQQAVASGQSQYVPLGMPQMAAHHVASPFMAAPVVNPPHWQQQQQHLQAPAPAQAAPVQAPPAPAAQEAST